MYSRGQSGPGGPATPSAPPNMSSSGGSSKPGSDYNYGYGSYASAADAGGYGAPPRSYGSDGSSQVSGYSSQPPNAGAKHFNDFKEWPSSWQPFDNGNNSAPSATTASKPQNNNNVRLYFNAAVKATIYADRLPSTDAVGGDEGEAAVALKHYNNLSNNMGMCCNSWKRVGLINMKRAAGLVTPAKINYSD